MKLRSVVLSLLASLSVCSLSYAQNFDIFFPAAKLDGQPDRFGNVYTVSPASAIDPLVVGTAGTPEGLFVEDNLWLQYQYEGNLMLLSHGPGFWENAPEITASIQVAYAGTYEVIFHFLDDNNAPGTGPIRAALGNAPLVTYADGSATRATGGTAPPYPFIGAGAGAAFWYTVSFGQVTVAANGTISVRVDDVQGDVENIASAPETASMFQGITLRVISGGPPLPEVQVSPGVSDWFTDLNGNQFRTWAQDETAYPTLESWRSTTRVDGAGMWNIRNGLGTFGPILESFPVNGNDAMPLRTSVRFAQGGTYRVVLSIGDIGQANETENATNPCPLAFGIEGEELVTYVPNDGVLNGTPGYNNYEIDIQSISVSANEQVNFIIDDVQGFPSGQRSVYLGIRLVLTDSGTDVGNWALY